MKKTSSFKKSRIKRFSGAINTSTFKEKNEVSPTKRTKSRKTYEEKALPQDLEDILIEELLKDLENNNA